MFPNGLLHWMSNRSPTQYANTNKSYSFPMTKANKVVSINQKRRQGIKKVRKKKGLTCLA